MKKTILTLAMVSLVAAGAQTAKAGDCGWTTAEKVLTGLTAATLVAQSLVPHSTAYTRSYSATPVVYATPPAPVCVAPPVRPCLGVPATVYVAPAAPVVVVRPRVYAAPVPAVRVNVRVHAYHHDYHHSHW